MKVQDLFEGKGYASRVGVDASKKRAADGSKLGRMTGGTDDWMEAINARMKKPITKTDIRAAGPEIVASSAYKALIDAGWKDATTSAAANNGTFVMKRPDGQKYHILWTGKVNDRTGYGGGILASTTPHIVPNDPVQTIVKTVTRSMKHLASKAKAVKEGKMETVKVGKMEMHKPLHDLIKDIGLPGGVETVAETGGMGDIELTPAQAEKVLAKAKLAGHKVEKAKGATYITSSADKSTYITLDYDHEEEGVVLAFVGTDAS